MKLQNERISRSPEMESRRKFLRRAAATALGAGVLLAGLDLTGTFAASHEVRSVGASITTGEQPNTRAQLITVTVFYSMLTQFTSLSQEVFVLQSPASLKDLIKTIAIRHPSMAQMMQMMLTLVNGVPTKPNASLEGGDVVQLIPLSAGG